MDKELEALANSLKSSGLAASMEDAVKRAAEMLGLDPMAGVPARPEQQKAAVNASEEKKEAEDTPAPAEDPAKPEEQAQESPTGENSENAVTEEKKESYA